MSLFSRRDPRAPLDDFAIFEANDGRQGGDAGVLDALEDEPHRRQAANHELEEVGPVEEPAAGELDEADPSRDPDEGGLDDGHSSERGSPRRLKERLDRGRWIFAAVPAALALGVIAIAQLGGGREKAPPAPAQVPAVQPAPTKPATSRAHAPRPRSKHRRRRHHVRPPAPAVRPRSAPPAPVPVTPAPLSSGQGASAEFTPERSAP